MTLVDNMSNQVNNWGGNFNVYDIREFGDYDFDAMVKYLALPSTKVLMYVIFGNSLTITGTPKVMLIMTVIKEPMNNSMLTWYASIIGTYVYV